jgi:spore coat polysaccharide biosynthesis protein SpsF
MNAIFITVRSGSTRLPNKATLKINGVPTIEHLIKRVKNSKLADVIVLCTTTLPEDDILCQIAEDNNIKYYRGSVKDKLERWKGACEKFNIDFFITADGDDLFCEPTLIDLALNQYITSKPDFIQTNEVVCGAFTFGIKYSALKKVCEIKGTDDTELMWVYFTDTGLFNVENLKNIPQLYKRKDIRMTLDYEDDFEFFKNVINYFNGEKFGLDDILSYIDTNPEVSKINFYLEQNWSENQSNNIKLVLKDGK